ncbi:MAG: MerR family transcriptional regulator [Myxococcales bacterium]|nr:MAG: MerR family transcriptional regulator [Myxococcales bacterium]
MGDLARAVGRTVRAIHLYEEMGLVKPTVRSKGKYRLFDASALVRVRWIAKLQDLGLTLGEIQGIVREWEQAPTAPGAMRLMRSTYAARLADTRAQIARLRALESELASSLRYLETCDTCDPARLIQACSCCERHDEQQPPPELVEGFRAGNRPGTQPPRRDETDV